jgi:lipopolysaccharide assembly outer membrane protein LptD (OstA)
VVFAQEFSIERLDSSMVNAGQNDSLANVNDTLGTSMDSLSLPDSLRLAEDFKSKVEYHAKDSVVYDLRGGMVYLYGNAWIVYEDIRLEADYIDISFDSKVLTAYGLPDSTGRIAGKPLFKQGGDEFRAEHLKYNFNTKRGKITDITTKDGDSYIHGATVKKEPDNTTFIRNGYYTTCEDPHPHYYLKSAKIKVIPNNKVVTSSADMYIMDVPTPVAIPFGFFPNRKGRSSGILFPQYGESQQLGFFLRNGGYYLGLNDHFDLALTGDIYSRGSWRANAYSNYAWRYKASGNVSVNYSNTRISRPEFPDYRLEEAFFLRWSHIQDPKLNPGTSFTANVNAGSSTFYQFNLSNSNNFLTNTFQSSIAWARNWTGKPFNLAVSLAHSQNTQTRDINLSLPSATFNVARQTPFRRKSAVGSQKWYEKIGVGLTTSFLNSISTKDTLLFTRQSLEEFRYGMQHSVPVNTSFTVAKYFTVSPGISYTERWYLRSIRKSWDPELQQVQTDTVDGFKAARDFAFSTSMNTRLYGIVQFRKGAIAAIRHVMTPTVGFSWRPDFSDPGFGNYKSVQADSTGRTSLYSIYEGTVFGGPGAGKSTLLNFSLDNNFEMKVRQKTDTALVEKKVKLLESLSLNTSYNFAADSLRLAPVNMAGRATILDKVSLFLAAGFDPYAVTDEGVRINTFELNKSGKLARFTSGNFSVNFNILKRKKELKSEKLSEDELSEVRRESERYVDFNVPFTLNVGYNFFYVNNVLVPDQITQTLNFNGDIQLTPAWKFTYNSGYDFEQKDISYTSLGIYRDLHCWEMSLNWVPFGFQQNFFFQINVKSSMLQDLKLTRKNDRFDNR